jgi:hypothetical protein
MSADHAALLERIQVYREHLAKVREDVTAVKTATELPSVANTDVRDVDWLRATALALIEDLERAQAALTPFAGALGLQVRTEVTVENHMGTPGRTVTETRWQDITNSNPAARYFGHATAKREALAARKAVRSEPFIHTGAQRAN